MRRDLGPVVIAVLVVLGTLFLVTGVGGGRYDLATGEWSFGERSSPAGTRVVGALMIGFALLLWISRPKP